MATKYWESVDGSSVLWHGDARDVLPEIEKESCHLLLTDPPYGVGYKSGMRSVGWEVAGDGADAESREVVEQVLVDCVQKIRRNRHLYVFGGAGGAEILRAADAKVSAPAELIWAKSLSMGDLKSPWGPAHEKIYFYTCLVVHGGQRGKEVGPARLRKGSVLEYGRKTGKGLRHPTEKPLGLLTELLESSSRVGERVLDPFAGIGSSGVAALLAGREWVGMELEEKWCEAAAERLEKAEKLREEAKKC